MPKLGEGKTAISSQIDAQQECYLRLRAASLGWTRAKVITAVIESWFIRGCPPLIENDKGLPAWPLKAQALTPPRRG
jgi:hypothetical protein